MASLLAQRSNVADHHCCIDNPKSPAASLKLKWQGVIL
jgi:hypothetical protein